ncbi:acid protease [Apiospora hydei]|uniref:Acid protease n=1 Tax=Apiospora hydei TaxID=1337664 RepID=A0ABR1V2H8_9PEZI
MALFRVIGACALASLASSAWGKDAGASSTFPNNHSATATPAPGGFRDSKELLSIPLRRVDSHAGGTTSVQRRYFKTNVIGVYGAAYLAELTVGTSISPQKVDVLLDTGSFELWVNPDCDKSNVPAFCRGFGQYDPTKSSTSQNLEQGFSIQYGSGSSSGTYYTDDIYISGTRIADQQFGVANTSDLVWFGIMGLGRGKGNGFLNYNTILDSVVAQGYANSRLFIMDLGSQGLPAGPVVSGEIVFGGVDRNKYAGNLVKVAIDGADAHYTVLLTGLTHRPPTAQTNSPVLDNLAPFPIIVDSGSTLSLLPQALVEALAAQFPGATSDGRGGYRVACSYQQQPGTVSFSFAASFSAPSPGADVTINLPYSEFVCNAGNDKCYLGAWYDNRVRVHILGDTFLRGAYVVFDQDSDALYMANYATCGGGGDLVAVPAGVDAALGIRGNCVEAGGAGEGAGPGGNNGGGSGGVSLPGGSVTPLGLGNSVDPTVNPAGPASVSATLTTNSETATPEVPETTPTAAASSPPDSAPPASDMPSTPGDTPTSTPFSGPGLDPNAVPASDSGGATTAPPATPSATPGTGGQPGDPNNSDPNLITPDAAGTGTMSGTITKTITNLIVTTVTACPTNTPVSGPPCVLGQVTTCTSVYVTTICPEATPKPITTPAPAPTSAPAMGGGAAPGAAAAPGAGAPPQPPPPPQGGGGAVFVTVKEQCYTSTFAVTSCPLGAAGAGCTVGMTTTQTYTAYRTVTATALGSSNSNSNPGGGNGNVVAGNVGYSLLLLARPCRPRRSSAVGLVLTATAAVMEVTEQCLCYPVRRGGAVVCCRGGGWRLE